MLLLMIFCHTFLLYASCTHSLKLFPDLLRLSQRYAATFSISIYFFFDDWHDSNLLSRAIWPKKHPVLLNTSGSNCLVSPISFRTDSFVLLVVHGMRSILLQHYSFRTSMTCVLHGIDDSAPYSLYQCNVYF